MSETGKLNGVFVGDADEEKAAVNVSIQVDERSVRLRVGALGSKESSMAESTDRKTRHFQQEMIELVRREAYRSREITTNFKEKPSKVKRNPVPVTCPDCSGYRSFDCDRCEGAGIVPG